MVCQDTHKGICCRMYFGRILFICHSQYPVQQFLNILVLHPHNCRRPAFMHTSLGFEYRKEEVFFYSYMPLKPHSEFFEISGCAFPVIFFHILCELDEDIIKPLVVCLKELSDCPFCIINLPLRNSHPPYMRTLLKGPPLKFTVMLGLKLVQEGFRFVVINKDKGFTRLKVIKCVEYPGMPVLRHHISYIKYLLHIPYLLLNLLSCLTFTKISADIIKIITTPKAASALKLFIITGPRNGAMPPLTPPRTVWTAIYLGVSLGDAILVMTT